MAASVPDVSLLTSSAQIFASNHTLPQIRAIHASLHGQVDDKAARLRTQVGGSYRELLGTADTIVQMRGDMDAVRHTLGTLGSRCGRAVVGRKVAALAAFVDEHGGGGRSSSSSSSRLSPSNEALRVAARARLLETCARTAGRLLSRSVAKENAKRTRKTRETRSPGGAGASATWEPVDVLTLTRGERLVLAAKVLVLSRLLLPSVEDDRASGRPTEKTQARLGILGGDAAVHASMEASKKKLGGLRRRLQNLVEAVERQVEFKAAAAGEEHVDKDNDGDDDDDNDDDDDGDHDKKGTGRRIRAAAAAREDLQRALCAYSLTTTSGTKDMLRQLLRVRSQAMAMALDLSGDDDEDVQARPSSHDAGHGHAASHASWTTARVLRGLALYTQTLLDVQALLPHRLPEALLGLKKRPLLDDAALRNQLAGLAGLGDLDMCARWCGDDVRFFKPYVRHDDLTAAEARDALASWAASGADVLLAGLERALEHEGGPGEGHARQKLGLSLSLTDMVDLRTRVLQLWIRDSSRLRGLDAGDLLDKMRAVFHRHMERVLSTKVAKLRLVGSEVAATVAAWQSSGGGGGRGGGGGGRASRPLSLWSDLDPDEEVSDEDKDEDEDEGESESEGDYLDMDLSTGAVPFVQSVVARLHGRSDAVAKAVASFVTWRHVVDEAEAVIGQLQRQRWENDADDMVEDEDTIAQRQQLLSRDDPRTLHDRLQADLAAAYADLDVQLAKTWAAVQGRSEDGHSKGTGSSAPVARTGAVAMYLVRVLREIRSRRPVQESKENKENKKEVEAAFSTSSLGLAIIPELHSEMARAVAAPALDHFVSVALARQTVAGRSLWGLEQEKGDESTRGLLPASPSPGVFKFLRDLSAAMTRAGLDLWSPTAVRVLRQHVTTILTEQWKEKLDTVAYISEEEGKGDDEDDDEDDESKKDENKDDMARKKLSADQRRDLLLQWMLDVAWLRCSLGPSAKPNKNTAIWTTLEESLYTRSGLSEEAEGLAARKRLTDAAQNYWKKTNLLFGLLV